MTKQERTYIPLDLDTSIGSEQLLAGSDLGRGLLDAIGAYLDGCYPAALERLKASLIEAYIGGEQQSHLSSRERAVIHLYSGNALAYGDQWDAAFDAYLEAVQTDPGLAEAHYNLGLAFGVRRQFEQATAAYKAALEHNPQLYEAHLALGRAYQRGGDPLRAYIHYSSAQELRPQAGEPHFYMGLMHLRQGAGELAAQSFAEAFATRAPAHALDGVPDWLRSRAEEENAAWYHRLADSLKAEGQPEEAERVYRALLSWRPADDRTHYLLGNLLARSRRWEDAVREYLQIRPASNHYLAAQLRVAAALRACGRLKQAYAVLYQCARQHPLESRLLVQMARILYDLGKPHAAARVLEWAVELRGDSAAAFYWLGFTYIAIDRESWAIATWRRAIQLAPAAWSLRYDLANLYIRRRRYALALTELTEVLLHLPGDVPTRFLLGLCYRELLEPGRAIPLFEEVLKVQPHHLQALYYLGACYLQTGNRVVGRAYLRRYDRLLRGSAAGQELGQPRRAEAIPFALVA